jgi:hypothetical protein
MLVSELVVKVITSWTKYGVIGLQNGQKAINVIESKDLKKKIKKSEL